MGRFLPRTSALISLGVALYFWAWAAWAPPPDYTLWPNSFPIPFGVIIFIALIWPVGLALQWVAGKSWALAVFIARKLRGGERRARQECERRTGA